MYIFTLTLQYISIIIVILGILVIFSSKKSEYQTILLLIFAANFINQFGLTLYMKSRTMEAALVANKFAYFGKIMAIFFTLYFAIVYCYGKKSSFIMSIFGILLSLIYYTVWTCENNTLYYKTIDYTTEGVYPHLVTTSGLSHNILNVLVFIVMIYVVCICTQCFVRTNDKEERQRLICIMLIPIIVIISFLIYKSGITNGYDCTVLAFLFGSVLLLYAVQKLNLIDYVAKAKEEIIDELSDAVFVLDHDDEIIYFNSQAEELFPSIREIAGMEIVDDISKCSTQYGGMWIGDKLYAIRKKEIDDGTKVQSVIYTLTDNTSNFILTYVDALTNAMNRRALMVTMDLNKPADNSWFVIMDVDNFKNINDTYGHHIGDECLKIYADALLEVFKREHVFRYGGDEFVVMIEMDESTLIKNLNDINMKLSDDSNEHPFHLSGGFVQIQEGDTVDELIKLSDVALYEVKKSGKGRFLKKDR